MQRYMFESLALLLCAHPDRAVDVPPVSDFSASYGWRRDLYFMTDHEWARLVGDYLGGISLAVGLLCIQLLWMVSTSMGCVGFAIGLFWALVLTSWGKRIVPRRAGWVRRFEQGRSRREVSHIRHCGTRAMRQDSRQFLAVINSPGGWDNWLMTVT